VAVQIQSIKKCGFLRQIAEGAKLAASTLKEALLAAQKGHFVSTFARGRLVVSQSGSGQSGSFEVSMNGKEWTQDNVFGLIEELIQMLDACVARGVPDAADPDIINTLFEALKDDINSGFYPQSGVTEQMGDFSGLNFHGTAVA
jgi:hypothetical protein